MCLKYSEKYSSSLTNQSPVLIKLTNQSPVILLLLSERFIVKIPRMASVRSDADSPERSGASRDQAEVSDVPEVQEIQEIQEIQGVPAVSQSV